MPSTTRKRAAGPSSRLSSPSYGGEGWGCCNGYYEEVENGRRYFDLYEDEVVTLPNPLRWFLIPGLMFLLGSLGCFFISFRWR